MFQRCIYIVETHRIANQLARRPERDNEARVGGRTRDDAFTARRRASLQLKRDSLRVRSATTVTPRQQLAHAEFSELCTRIVPGAES